MTSLNTTPFRYAAGTVFLICALLLGYAYWLQHVDFLDPCPLCIFQRLAFFWMGAAALAAAVHDPGPFGRAVYALVTALGGMVGSLIAGRHIYLQTLPPDQVPECGPGLEFMLSTLPWNDVVEKVLTGSGECADISWTFLNLSMPWWTLFWFIALSVPLAVFARGRT
ncbi:MAG: disulfide bond formation protein B [Arenicellales bacterium]|jgi:disulfide bond formation protein DsbB